MRHARFSFAQGRSVAGSLLGAGAVWLGLAGFGQLHAKDSPVASASLSATQAVYLEYRELSHGATFYNLPLSTQSARFKKEPPLGLRKVARGTLNFGSSSGHFVPFLWDRAKGKLYLDLNRNQDFTDDAGGVFSCSGRLDYANNYQTFTNIHVAFKTPQGTHPALVDVNLYDYNQVVGNFAPRSYWAGKATFRGRECELGLIEDVAANPGSTERASLLLRPWAERDRAFDLQDGSLDGFPFCRSLFFDGQAYDLNCAYVAQGGAPRYRIDLEKRGAELGELRTTGKFIKRILLHGSKFSVVMDQPEAVVKVPVGAYDPCQVQLKQGAAEAYRQVARFGGSQPGNATTVSAGRPVVLTMGGPLTNSLTVTPHGRSLNLNYQLLGAGGETYQLLGARQAPEFAAYRGGRQIASGTFQFG